jgi:predicted acyl esterase
MKRAILFGWLAGAVLLIGQGGDAPVFVDYQEVMIPMRDGVRLQTVLLTPKMPGSNAVSIDRHHTVPGKGDGEGTPGEPALAERNYIFVSQNIRGRFQSEANSSCWPPHGPRTPREWMRL